MTSADLNLKHVICLTYLEIFVLLNIPHKPSEGFIFSTNSAILATFACLFLSIVWGVQVQVGWNSHSIAALWENINIFRKTALTVFCIRADAASQLILLFSVIRLLVCTPVRGSRLGKYFVARCFSDAVCDVFAFLIMTRVLLKGKGLFIVASVVNSIYLRDLKCIAYLSHQMYVVCVMILVN